MVDTAENDFFCDILSTRRGGTDETLRHVWQRRVREEVKGVGSTFEELPLFLTPKQLAEIMGEHEGSIRRGIAEGRIPADKVNGRWRICRDVVFANTKKGVMRRETDHE